MIEMLILVAVVIVLYVLIHTHDVLVHISNSLDRLASVKNEQDEVYALRMESFEQDDSGVVCNFKAELDKESQQ